MIDQTLTGIDGKNPVGFLAALGVLRAMGKLTGDTKRPALRWELAGDYRPVLVNGPDRDGLLDLLVRDAQELQSEPAITELRYAKSDGERVAHDLKPKPGRFQTYLRGLIESGSPESLRMASAFATDVAEDNNGNVKPTALHFTAGQQEFLAMVEELAEGVTREDLEEALFGPWRYTRALPVLGWDNSVSRDYALRASDPSKDKKLGVPGADWLAFRGLSFLRVAPIRNRIATTGCKGEWKTGTFRWPIWRVPATEEVIGSLLTSPELFEMSPRALRARGVEVVFEAAIRRSEQGGYGSFTPARVAEAARA